MSFQTFKQHPLYLRKEQSARIKAKYPDRVPVIVEKYKNSLNAPNIDKNKFLVPGDSTVGAFLYIIRKRMQLSEKAALFLYCGNNIPPTSELMSIVYERYRNEDGFLYIVYAVDNVFGTFGQ
jgi:GABA(A) receptor-associated protein